MVHLFEFLMRFKIIVLLSIVLVFLLSRHVAAADNGNVPLLRKTIFGLFIHDRGPTSDKHEGGVDPNWEIQFNGPDWKLWQWIGAPFPGLERLFQWWV